MFSLRRCAVALLLALTLFAVQASLAFGDDASQLDQTRAEKAQKQAELDAAKATDEQLQAKVNELKNQLADQGPKVEAAKKSYDTAEQAVAAAAEQIKRTEREAGKRQDLLNQRAVAAYKAPDSGVADAVLGAGDISEAGLRIADMQRVIDNDHNVVMQLAKVKADLDEDKKQFEADQANAKIAKDAQQAEFNKLADLKVSSEATQKVLDKRVDDLKSEVDALAAEENKIQSTIRSKQAAAEAALKKPPPGKGSGGSSSNDAGPAGPPSSHGFIWPVNGPINSPFGMRWGRLHAGIDIGASTGTPIRASADGIVIFTGWQGGYGNLTLIAHGGGIVTAYAHQSSIGVGDGARVSQGQVIGNVGCTGSCTGPHLHFEVRVNGSPVNPLGYL